jgi:hypothetical protein
MIVCLSKFQNYTRVMSNDNNNLHILKRIKDIDYKGIISSAVAVYFKEGVVAYQQFISLFPLPTLC